eukprot:TRINITY_DN707_c0_g1_i2.p1 TRINITY_DN707_c0_g1~~TRINITY_DN707_c0_g1_i2.p1  ORF type:complete len:153 (+),score=37.63 TRINITY_DN707_c0_g1_i2:66-524(+)
MADEDWDHLLDDDDLTAKQRENFGKAALVQKQLEALKSKGHGEYREIVSDQFLPEVTAANWVVCHFFKDDFNRCKILDRHLKELAAKHIKTKFLKISAPDAPFFVAKLNVKVLPTLCFFIGGVCVDRIVGFEDLGGDNFTSATLAKRIAKAG